MSDTEKYSFWEFKKYEEHEWFKFLFLLLLVIMAVYMLLHGWRNDKSGYEYARLDKDQLQQVNRIYFDTAPSIRTARDTPVAVSHNNNSATSGTSKPSIKVDTASAPAIARIQDSTRRNASARSQDSAKTSDTTVKTKHPSSSSTNNTLYTIKGNYPDSTKCQRTIHYLQIAFSEKIDTCQLQAFESYLCTARPLEAVDFLTKVRLRVRSYFWLTGPEVYFEIVFWSWFGVISSLLFNLSIVARNRTTDQLNSQSEFDSSEIPYQFAKFGYAPLCTLTIVLGYNFFNDQNIADISSSKGVIVFAFLGGFYSARLIAFLDRLKEVILPNAGTADLPSQEPSKPLLLTDITLKLTPDDKSLEPDVINEFAERGMGDAKVTLEHESTAKLYTAERSEEDQTSSFVVSNIPPGKYLISADVTKEVGGRAVTLTAQQREDIEASKSTITVTLKKADEEG
jgi:hypothetical protein